jgi:RNA-dependent RNA polymerase
MGYFDGEKNILKRYARRGQCFSTTQNMQKLHKEEISVGYPDIERNGFVFSDGCGWIEPSFAE